MRGRGHLHRITIGRTRDVRGPDALERAAAGVVIFVVMTFAFGVGMRQIRMVKALDAVVLASGPYYDEIVYRSVHGAWPSPEGSIVGGNVEGRYAKNIRLDPHGGITIDLTLDVPPFGAVRSSAGNAAQASGSLSFRPERLGSPDFPAFTLLCGHARPVGVGQVEAVNHTTLARGALPPTCR